MATPSLYKKKIKFSPNKIKKQVMPSSGNTSSKMRGPQNGNSIGECLEGQTWTQVEGNVTFDWSISGYPLYMSLYDWVLITRWELWYIYLWCMFGYYCSLEMLTCWLHRLILLPTSCCMIILLSWTCIFSFLYISFILTWLILFVV